MSNNNRYKNFRQEMYGMLGNGKDAVFDLMDSVMTTRNVHCLGELYNSPFFRRQWSSVYEGIKDSRPQRKNLMKRYIEEIPKSDYILLGIDHTGWSMPEAKTMQDRGVIYSASSKNGTELGQKYSTITWLPAGEKSWALPLRNERITSFETALTKASWQLKQVCKEIKVEKILVVLDCEYGNSSWIKQTAEIEVSKLMRIRSNSCLYENPGEYGGVGRPKRHGRKFKLNAQAQQWEPDEVVEIEEEKLGILRVSKWSKLHFKKYYEGEFSLIKVERLNRKKTGENHRPLWLIWVGEEFLPLAEVWPQYARRFGIEHWYRFAKQRLHWNLPSFGTVQQCERWSDLMPLITWQLWLARELVAEHRLPWQKPQTDLTPERVAQSIFALLIEIGSPAPPPKTRGKSAGWQKGRKRKKRKTYPTVKKQYSKPKKLKKKVS